MLPTLLLLVGQATQPMREAPRQPGGNPLSMFMPLILIFVVFYFILIRPRQKEQRRREQMLKELKKYDRVMTIGGIIGTVVEVREDEVTLKVDESSNTRLRLGRSAVQRVIKPVDQKE